MHEEDRTFHGRHNMKDRKMKENKVPGKSKREQVSKVWVNPNSTLKHLRENRAWDRHQFSPSAAARLLELADVALGSGRPAASVRKKKAAA